MNIGSLELLIFVAILTVAALIIGKYIAYVFSERCTWLCWLYAPITKLIDTKTAMSWQQYTYSLLAFNVIGLIFVLTVQLLQAYLPLNPAHVVNVSPALAFNTAISFVTNTNWQAYSGETTMSYLTQMLALNGQNFLSAATGIAVAVAIIRGFTQQRSDTIGNFWYDITKTTIYILLPLSILWAILLLWQGVPQNFHQYIVAHLLETVQSGHNTIATQVIPQGPVASQEAIKMLGTNGGGYFNANSAHPYENPTIISNWLEMIGLLLIPAALCFTFGYMLNDQRQGITLYITMLIVFVLATLSIMALELHGNPWLQHLHLHINDTMSKWQSGGNMEGKEVRFGIFDSSLFATATTAASCGAVNTMHDALMPLSGMITMFLMQLSEVIFGGVGSGLYGMIVFAILSVFIAGLMIGRTPEYLGKKIESFEIKMIVIIILLVPFVVLIGTALSLVTNVGISAIGNPSMHGLSEILYAFTSTANNNGSAFAGLNANTSYYNIMLAISMAIGRFGVIVPILAIAGSMAKKQHTPASSGTMPTHGVMFICILLGVILLVGALTYVPALALGPIVEHMILFQ
jgi:potassium-transporting ATPase potassium-binding subunit